MSKVPYFVLMASLSSNSPTLSILIDGILAETPPAYSGPKSRCTVSLLKLINVTYFQNYLTRGGAQSSSTRKPAVSVIFLHSKQQKTFQGTLGTQDLTSIGSFRLCLLFLHYTFSSPFNHVRPLFFGHY